MPDNYSTFPCTENQNNFKEAVCIDAYRVFDSCADKDCLENLRVCFTEAGQHVIDQACNVRLRSVDVITVYLDLEPVPFQKGFYAVDMTFFFEVCLDVFMAPAAMLVTVTGISLFSKKVILYGSEGSVKIYSSDFCADDNDIQNIPTRNLPKATVQVADPVALSARLCENRKCCCDCHYNIPDCICRRYGGEFITQNTNKTVEVTIGLFTIVQIERNVQMLVPTYDYCIPEKECVTPTDNPCEMFSRLEFPTNEFFPPKASSDIIDGETGCGCGCGSNKYKKSEY